MSEFANRIQIVLLLLCTLCISVCVANPFATLSFEHVTIEQGLSQNTVTVTFQDSQGFIWIGTCDGLNRYDGHQFRVFRHQVDDDSSISNNIVTAIVEDTDGFLWVGTGGGLNRFDRSTEQFQRYLHDDKKPSSISHNHVTGIAQLHGGDLWLSTFSGLNRFNIETGIFQRFGPEQGLNHLKLKTLSFDQQGTLWIASVHGGLYRLNIDSFAFHQFASNPQDIRTIDHNAVLSLFISNRNVLWLGTRTGLNRYDGDGLFTRFTAQPGVEGKLNYGLVNSINQIDRDSLWVGTEGGGLNILDLNSFEFSQYRKDLGDNASLSGDDIIHIYRANKGVMWVGTGGSGVNKVDTSKRQFGLLKAKAGQPIGLNHPSVVSAIKDRLGRLWVGTYGGGINRISADGMHIDIYRHDSQNSNSLGNDKVINLYEDSSGDIWVGLFESGLNRYRPETDDFERYTHDSNDENSLNHNWVSSMAEWRSGIYIIGTVGDGISVFNRNTGKFKRYRHDENSQYGIENNTIYQVYIDRRSNVWLGAHNGLKRFDVKTGTFNYYVNDKAREDSISRGFVSSIYEDNHGQLWVAVYGGGLHKFNHEKGSFKAFRESDGLSNSGIYRLVGDSLGNIWISTNIGLSRFNIAREEFTNFDVNDGLQSNEFNINAGSRAKDGELIFGGVNGLNRFYPQNIKSDKQAPKLSFTDMRVFNHLVGIGQTGQKPQQVPYALPHSISTIKIVNLSYQQSLVSFEFAALDFVAHQKVNYAYKLEGFDKDWIYTDANNRRATYTDLPFDKFRLKVKAANSSGVWNEQGIGLDIVVTPPPWATWWAYVIYVFVFLVAIGAIVLASIQRNKLISDQKVVQRLKQIDRLKDEFLANTSHELRTPLNGIIGVAEGLINGSTGELSRNTKDDLQMLVESGQRLSRLINDILDLSKLKHSSIVLSPELVNLHQLVDIVVKLSQPLLMDKPVTIHNGISKEMPYIEADKDRLLQVLHNLVSNGVKFTDVGRVSVHAKVVEREVKITVSDTGIGIPKDKFDTIFSSFKQIQADECRVVGGTGLGLTISKQLIELHGGKIWIESIVSQGASFHFTLPIEAKVCYPDQESLIIASPMYQADMPVEQKPLLNEQGIKKYHCDFDGEEFTILIVDDEPINLHALSNHLSLQHYHIVQANNGIEALQYISSRQFDLVILDVMMPKMSGYDVCRKIREKYSINELPVLFLTAKNQVGDSVKAFASGGNDHLIKPIDKHELLVRVETHLRLLQANRTLSDKGILVGQQPPAE